jgi:prepilin-type N-terminal cleavage/methylation domain-containing protein
MLYRINTWPGRAVCCGPCVRRAFTLLEITVALAVLGMALGLVAEVAVWALQERGRLVDQQTMQELGANVLEQARACSSKELNAEWAKQQRLPEPYAKQGWHMDVRVAPEEGRPLVHRVTVTIRPPSGDGPTIQPLELVGLFADRSAMRKEAGNDKDK